MSPAPHKQKTGLSQNSVSWTQARPAQVVLVAGPENYLGTRAFDLIRRQVREHQPETETIHLNALNYAAGQLEMHASPSLFGDSKLIEVVQLEQMTDDFLTDALQYVRGPAADVVLVLRHGGGNRGKKLLDAIQQSGAPVIDCQPLKKDSDKVAFVTSEFRASGRRIDLEAVRALVSATGSQLADLAAACQQLSSDVEGTITAESVEKYYGGRVEATAFKVADAAMAGRGGQALSMARHALATGVDPVPLVAALAMKVRTVGRVIQASGSSAQLARDLGMAPWQIEQARRDGRSWSPEAVIRSIKVLAEADAQVKGASRDPVYAVERAITAISRGNRS